MTEFSIRIPRIDCEAIEPQQEVSPKISGDLPGRTPEGHLIDLISGRPIIVSPEPLRDSETATSKKIFRSEFVAISPLEGPSEDHGIYNIKE